MEGKLSWPIVKEAATMEGKLSWPIATVGLPGLNNMSAYAEYQVGRETGEN